MILLRYLLKIIEIVKLPIEQTEKKNKKVFILRIPMKITCRTFINELMHTIKAVVEVAWTGDSFSFLSIGTKKIPPPKPKPVKIPAQKLLTKIYLIF